MKYNQPYGISDPNASYINGNTTTGTMGSIPPAASIENPQREIANFIGKSALTPTDADLDQLSKAVQSGKVTYAIDGGSTNHIAITPVVPLAAYVAGVRFCIKVSYGNTSAVTVNVSGLGNKPLVHSDLSPVVAYELKAGQLIETAYDGTNFQMLAGGAPGGSAITLTAPTNVYVNATTGDDTVYDGTSATVGAAGVGPFKTIAKALTTMTKYNLGGWNFYINVADGVYTTTAVMRAPMPNGSGAVVLQGNSANPDNVKIFNTGTGSCWFFQFGGNWLVDGFSFRATAAAVGDAGNGIWLAGGSIMSLGNVAFNACPGDHIQAGDGCSIYMSQKFQIIGSSGGAHVNCGGNSNVGCTQTNPPGKVQLTISNAVTMPTFAICSTGAQLQLGYDTITGAANVTAAKHSVFGNGVLNLLARGASYLPGNTAGSVATGGQVI